MSWVQWLKKYAPRTGRLITERGTLVNQADVLESQQLGSDAFGNTLVAEYTPVVERKPLPGFSELRDQITGAGTIGVSGGELNLDGTAGTTSLYTRDYGRYIPGTYGVAGIGVRFSTPGTGTYEYGYGNGVGNRAGIEVVNGTFYTFAEAGGVRYYRKPRSEWLDPLDGTGPSGLTLNEAQHVFRLKIGWYGYLELTYYIAVADRVGGTRLVLIDRSEERDGVNLEQPDLPIFAEATGGVLNIGGRQFGVLGRYRPQFRITSALGNATADTSFTPICSLRIKTTASWSSVPVNLSGLSVLSANNGDVGIIIGGTLTGATFGDVPNIDPTETALEYDSAATAISGGYLAYAGSVAGGQANTSGSKSTDIPDVQIPRTLTVTLVAKADAATSDVQGTLRLKEEW